VNIRKGLIEFTVFQFYIKRASNSDSGNQVKNIQWEVIMQETGL